MNSTPSIPLRSFNQRQWLAFWLCALAPALVGHAAVALTGAHWFTRGEYVAAAAAWSVVPAAWLAAHLTQGFGARALGALLMAALLLGANFLPFAGSCCSTMFH